jgi:hypothetical protein
MDIRSNMNAKERQIELIKADCEAQIAHLNERPTREQAITRAKALKEEHPNGNYVVSRDCPFYPGDENNYSVHRVDKTSAIFLLGEIVYDSSKEK